MLIVGINAYHGDVSAVVLADGKLLFAAEEERFNRIKHSAGLPRHTLRQALEKIGTPPDEIDYITISRNPAANFLPKLGFILGKRPGLSFLKDRLGVTVRSGKILKDLPPLTAAEATASSRGRTAVPVLARSARAGGGGGAPAPAYRQAGAGRQAGSRPLTLTLSPKWRGEKQGPSPSPPKRGEGWGEGLNGVKIERVEHHLSHAASAFYPSGFDQAALLTVDGFGDFSSTMFGVGEGNRIKVLKRVLFPHSLGVLYTAATQYLGFPKYGDEYKVMGLAAFGEPRFLKAFHKLIQLTSDGSFKLNLDYFVHPAGKTEMTWEEGEPVLGLAYSEKWKELFGPPRHPEDPITERDKDLAASAQAVFEETFFHLLKHLHEKTGLKTLCLAGGCAFNSAAGGKIFDHSPFEKVYTQSAAGDAGTALGSALYLYHHRLNQPRNFVMDHAYWGPEFEEKEISEELNRQHIVILSGTSYECAKARAKDLKSFSPSGFRMTAQRIQDEVALCQKAARAIVDGKIVGWFQGRMEWGPRALGNRSILADPRKAEMRDILNARIKHREDFRPFAPSVLEEKAGEWFEMKTPSSPFMNFVFPVRSEKKEKIPAVTHEDGTARVHTVACEANPLFWNLIAEFEKISGVPMLLNTSFNDNEPIVCTPKDAVDCFLRTRMDILVLGSFWIQPHKEF